MVENQPGPGALQRVERAVTGSPGEAELQTDVFAVMFERAFRGAAEHYQREKLEAFRGILVNAAIRRDVP